MPGVGSVIIPGAANPFLALPGANQAYASAPNSAALQITGPITIDVKADLHNWTPATNQSLCAKYGSSTTISYELYVNSGGSTGKLVFRCSANGTTLTNVLQSSAAVPFTGVGWVRASFTPSTGVCQFFTSSDGTTWSQLGTNITGTAMAGGIFASTAVLEMGTDNTGTQSPSNGSFYEVKIYNSALGSGSGTPVFDANFAGKSFGANTFTESSANAATVTLNNRAQLGDGRGSFSTATIVQAPTRAAVR